MSLDYYSFVTRFGELTGTLKKDVNWPIIVPSAIEYAEQRIYRELDLLHTYVTDATTQLSSGIREFNLSTSIGTFITVDELNLIVPASTPSSTGTRVPLVSVSPEFLNAAWPGPANSSGSGVPQYYAVFSDTLILLGPAPDAPYFVETIGTQRPSPLSSGNSSTALTQYIPDVFMAAALVYASDYLHLSEGPPNKQPSETYEKQYQLLKQSAEVEQLRAVHRSEAWTSQSPSQLARRKT